MPDDPAKIVPSLRANKQTAQLRALRKQGAVAVGARVRVTWGRGHFMGTVTGEYHHAANGFEIGGHVWIVTDDDGKARRVCHDLACLARVERPMH